MHITEETVNLQAYFEPSIENMKNKIQKREQIII